MGNILRVVSIVCSASIPAAAAQDDGGGNEAMRWKLLDNFPSSRDCGTLSMEEYFGGSSGTAPCPRDKPSCMLPKAPGRQIYPRLFRSVENSNLQLSSLRAATTRDLLHQK